MECNTAIILVGLVVMEPGWEMTAKDHTDRFEACIEIRVDYPARNTNRDQAPDGFPEHICTYAKFPVIVGDISDQDDLYRRIFACLMKIKAHELREIFRIKPTYWAPFHPHRMDGMMRYGGDEGQGMDLMFGIT